MATITYKVTVATGTTQYGTGNRFYINGELAPVLYLQEGNTYIFDQSDNTNGAGLATYVQFPGTGIRCDTSLNLTIGTSVTSCTIFFG